MIFFGHVGGFLFGILVVPLLFVQCKPAEIALGRLVLQWHPDRNPADRDTAEAALPFFCVGAE